MPYLSESFGISGPLALTTTKQTRALSREDGCKLTRPLFLLLIICVFSLPAQAQYCSASGGCTGTGGTLNIDSVQVGSINNTGTGCSGYADYTSLSTTMEIGTGYTITVTNGDPYDASDQCGIWVDWNADGDFDDAGEEISVSGGNVIFTATITPPGGASLGATRMRIRIRWTGTLDPCGNTTYGEVEDYTINVAAGGPPGNGGGGWQEQAKLTASDAKTWDWFGWSVAISGSTALVTATGSSGPAYLFDVSDPSNPVEIAKLTASDAAAGDRFGWSVAISGSTAIVGAYANDDAGTDSGSAYLFDFSDPCSIIETKLTASDAAAWDLFGYSVALSGSTAIVGAYANDDAGDESGSAYLFDAATGSQLFKLTASDAAAGDFFGGGVAISGASAIVGANHDDDAGSQSGSAYLFDVATGVQLFKLTASDAAAFDYFGSSGSVAISGNTAIVGAPFNDGACPADPECNFGSAYLFDVATGVQLFKLTASDAADGCRFGSAVAISGSTALVGAHFDDDAGSNSGSAYLYDFTDPCNIIETKLTASDAAAWDEFGRSVAVSGSTAIVGAPYDDDAGDKSGSAYLFGPCLFPPVGDINLDCRVDCRDLAVLCDQWLLELIPADVGPDGGDGFVNFFDWAIFADGWQTIHDIFDLADFADQWLKTGANDLIADIAPAPDGDGIVNMVDYTLLAENWMEGL